ncbi:hypothetical protein GGI35DRAFT_57791 [Trichoderma velutinum]
MGGLPRILLLLLIQPATESSILFLSKSSRFLMNERYPATSTCYSISSNFVILNNWIPARNPQHQSDIYTTAKTKSQITVAAMCVHFRSWNRCSSCFLTFNRRCNRVPCWNGSLSRWRIHRHGLSCRSGWYERADDEVYTDLSCELCNMEAANGAESKADMMETRDAALLRGQLGTRATTAARKRPADISSVFMRLWSFREVLRVRGNSRKGKRHLRMRIWML